MGAPKSAASRPAAASGNHWRWSDRPAGLEIRLFQNRSGAAPVRFPEREFRSQRAQPRLLTWIVGGLHSSTIPASKQLGTLSGVSAGIVWESITRRLFSTLCTMPPISAPSTSPCRSMKRVSAPTPPEQNRAIAQIRDKAGGWRCGRWWRRTHPYVPRPFLQNPGQRRSLIRP